MLPTIAVRTRLRSLVQRKLERTSIVLCYHRIAEVGHDPDRLAVSPRHFAEHMEVVARWRACAIESLLEDGLRPHGGVLVTMDDAYRDTLINAAPILRRHGVPAVVFAPSELCARGELFWWEVLRRLFAAESRVPAEALGEMGAWLAAEVAARRPGAEAALEAGEAFGASAMPYLRFSDLLRKADDGTRGGFLERGMALLGGNGARDGGYPMSPDELRQISEDGLIEIGGHTRTHVRLAALARAEQLREIAEDKRALEAMLGRVVRCFAYPYGSPTVDFNDDSVSAAREAGYRVAFASAHALIREDSDRMELGRFWGEDYDGDELARRLVLWFGRPASGRGKSKAHSGVQA